MFDVYVGMLHLGWHHYCMHWSIIMDINFGNLMRFMEIDEVRKTERESSGYKLPSSLDIMTSFNGLYQIQDDDEISYNYKFLCAFCGNRVCDYLCLNGVFWVGISFIWCSLVIKVRNPFTPAATISQSMNTLRGFFVSWRKFKLSGTTFIKCGDYAR